MGAVCDTRKRSLLRARRPSAAAMPGQCQRISWSGTGTDLPARDPASATFVRPRGRRTRPTRLRSRQNARTIRETGNSSTCREERVGVRAVGVGRFLLKPQTINPSAGDDTSGLAHCRDAAASGVSQGRIVAPRQTDAAREPSLPSNTPTRSRRTNFFADFFQGLSRTQNPWPRPRPRTHCPEAVRVRASGRPRRAASARPKRGRCSAGAAPTDRLRPGRWPDGPVYPSGRIPAPNRTRPARVAGIFFFDSSKMSGSPLDCRLEG